MLYRSVDDPLLSSCELPLAALCALDQLTDKADTDLELTHSPTCSNWLHEDGSLYSLVRLPITSSSQTRLDRTGSPFLTDLMKLRFEIYTHLTTDRQIVLLYDNDHRGYHRLQQQMNKKHSANTPTESTSSTQRSAIKLRRHKRNKNDNENQSL